MKKPSASLVICCLLAAVTALAYAGVGGHQFINYDDNCYVTDNRHVQPGVTWDGLVWAFGRFHGERTYWHPLTWVSHMLDCQCFGLKPAGHHLTNLLLHVVNTLLVFLAFRRVTGAVWRCALVAGLFALHPLQVDTVAWVAERKNLLSAMFWLLSMWAYARYAETSRGHGPEATVHGPRSTAGRVMDARAAEGAAAAVSCFTVAGSRFYLLSLILFSFGLMCKPVLVTLPFVLLLLDYWPLRRLQTPVAAPISRFTSHVSAPALRTALRLAVEKAPFFLLAGASCLITIAAHRGLGSLGNGAGLSFGLRIENAIVSYVRYLGKTAFPTHLAILYPYPGSWPLGTVLLCTLLLLAVSVLVIALLRSHPYLFVGWFWFLGVLVPFIGIVQAGEQAMADRFMYVPILGLFIMAVWGLEALFRPWARRPEWLAAPAGLVLAGCLVATSLQLRYWQNSETLFRHAIQVTAANYSAYDGLGTALDAQGRRQEAFACLAESVRLRPRYAEGQYDLGTVLLRMGKPEEAAQHLAVAVESQPDFAQAHINFGKALLDQGKLDLAAAHFSKGVELAPDDPEAHYNLGTVVLMQGSVSQAVACFSTAVRLNPDYGEAHSNLGVALMRAGKPELGAVHLAAAAKLNPSSPDAHNNLGLALLELNHPEDAAEEFSHAVRLNPDSPGPQYYLAVALLRQNKPQEALPHARKARDLAQAAGQAAFVAKAEALLAGQR